MEMLNQLKQQLQALEEQDLIRTRRTVDTPCGPRVSVGGRELLAFCTNDYLGLANHRKIKLALQEGAAMYGVGSGASHLISGHGRAHAMLEERLVEFVGAHLVSPRALTFCTGYMANLAIVTGLTAGDRDADIFSESLNHASLIDGARLSRANVKVYPHADLEALAQMLAASKAATKLVVTDSVFSMDGDLAPLPQLLALCEQYGAWLVVDDAHGFGTLGANGHGALEHFDLRSPNLVYMGTLGKAAGVSGAFVAAHETVIETLIQKARPYIFTTATPPALAHALLTSLELLEGDEGRNRRAQLQALVAQLDDGLRLKRWQRLPSMTAIQPILIGDNAETMRAGAALYEQGLWVGTIRPPTVAPGTSRLRVTLSAGHSSMEVAKLIAAINALERT
ncbi:MULTISPECIES: 8-amino-7-oxononanoate synthase [unclassified Duganella]|uniref:8-amino-7-oxononanoate synthase n=1 Tax=unclassified Duganella TaxID=2636909 RepID=UPI000E340929|nr:MULTISPECIES: 8-amino-7-oxononanoate synthase [unclassified Duganella]RFP12897.1 8-amino-7-oxononanoate synthase [Duganella sp. BJB475]RFP28906.1 8-amino-7-oxononanoate synthase [Duganella sp. BJB476]